MRIPRRVPPVVPHFDMRGRVCVVTGASSGIGLETARGLLQRGAEVVAIGRSEERLARALETLRGDAVGVGGAGGSGTGGSGAGGSGAGGSGTGGSGAGDWGAGGSGGGAVHGMLADFASLQQVRQLAARLLAAHPRMDVLVNNAGVWNNTRKESAEGHEHTFAVNHLAPFLLTLLLAERLAASPYARVVNVSSRLHRKAQAFDFEDVHQRARRYSGLRAYHQSKLANVLFTRELARRAPMLRVNAVHPGDVATDVVRDSRLLAWGTRNIGRLWLLTPEEGARTTLFVTTSPDLDATSGRYFARCTQRAPSPAAHDDSQAARLWTLSEQLTDQQLTL